MKNKIAIILTLQFIITVFAFSGCGESTSSYFVKSYTSSCSNKSLHTQLALYVAKNKVKKPGSYKVTGSTYGTVSYLG